MTIVVVVVYDSRLVDMGLFGYAQPPFSKGLVRSLIKCRNNKARLMPALKQFP